MTDFDRSDDAVGDSFDWKLVDRYLAGEATDEEARAVEEWMGDPQLGPTIVAQLESEDGQDWDVEGAWHNVRARTSEAPVGADVTPIAAARGTGLGGRMVRAAAAITVLLGGAAIWSQFAGQGVTHRVATGAANETVLLEDGTSVVLGPGTLLSHRGLDGDVRQVELEGVGFFDVAHDPTRPFRVVANGTVTEVLGTEFTVEAYDGVQGVEVTVMSGAVSLGFSERPEADAVVLSPGQVGSTASGSVEVTNPESVSERSAWLEGRFVLQDKPLAEAVRHMERWFGVQMRLDGESLADQAVLYTGGPDDTIEDVLQIIAPALGADWEEERPGVYVLRPSAGG